jgi:thiamine biosynthesis lipoprotein
MIDLAPGEMCARGRAMATDVVIRAPRPSGEPAAPALEDALGVFARVERACTRFDPRSPLMAANASPSRWHRVPPDCFAAIAAAHSAYLRTHGVFDPRVLNDLVALGYDRTLPFSGSEVEVAAVPQVRRTPLGRWRPRFRGSTREVVIGAHPIDLGGIGKGLAIRWAAERLATEVPDHLIEVGGDCWCGGVSAEGTPWRIGIEDPLGGEQPVAVLQLSGLACATSSTRVRRWKASGQAVHHLLDPRTGRPGGAGLLSVTVVDRDPAMAEVWAKTLFLCGAGRIAAAAQRRRLAAAWVSAAGDLAASRDMRPYLLWQR